MQRFFDRRSLILILILAYLGPIRALMNNGTAGLSNWIVSTLITIPGIIIGLSGVGATFLAISKGWMVASMTTGVIATIFFFMFIFFQ